MNIRIAQSPSRAALPIFAVIGYLLISGLATVCFTALLDGAWRTAFLAVAAPMVCAGAWTIYKTVAAVDLND